MFIKVFLISGVFWNLLKRHLICGGFFLFYFFMRSLVFSEKKSAVGFVLVSRNRWMQEDRDSFPKELVQSCLEHIPMSHTQARRVTDLWEGMCLHLSLS